MNYDYERENHKACPVCGVAIDYHRDGFIHYERENAWVHRDHTVAETETGLGRRLNVREICWVFGLTYPLPAYVYPSREKRHIARELRKQGITRAVFRRQRAAR